MHMKRTKQANNPPTQTPAKPRDRVQPGTHLDISIYHRAKIQAMTEGITTGELIDRAILLYLDHVNKEAIQ
jgi:hypothetical protein